MNSYTIKIFHDFSGNTLLTYQLYRRYYDIQSIVTYIVPICFFFCSCNFSANSMFSKMQLSLFGNTIKYQLQEYYI